jgi:hypothetical protein
MGVVEVFTLPIKAVGTRADTAGGQLGPMGTREELDPCPIPTAVFRGGLMPCKALGLGSLGKQPSPWLLCRGTLILSCPGFPQKSSHFLETKWVGRHGREPTLTPVPCMVQGWKFVILPIEGVWANSFLRACPMNVFAFL